MIKWVRVVLPFIRRRKLAPLKTWKLLRVILVILISVCTLGITHKLAFNVEKLCPTYGSAIFPEYGNGLSKQHLRQTARPVNGEYCNKCRGFGRITKGEVAAGPSQRTTKRFDAPGAKLPSCRVPDSTETVPDLKQVKLFQSQKSRPRLAGITIVTQLSLERLPMLTQQCSLWPHPIAAALYIPLVQGKIFSAEISEWDGAPLKTALDALAAMHAAFENSTERSCLLDLAVVVEEVCTLQKAFLDYPVNALRNRALVLASTDLVLLLDVDFIVDQNLALTTASNTTLRSELVGMLSQGAAMVLPAFETADEGEAGIQLATTAVKRGKSYLVSSLKSNDVVPFHGCVYPPGHRATEFLYWLRGSTTKPYRIIYEESYEPYLLMKKSFVPFYDERFTGRNRNKMQHIRHIAVQSKLALIVHPHHFVIHLPHQESFARQHQYDDGTFNGLQRSHQMEAYYQESIKEMEKRQYVPTVRSFSHLCLSHDDDAGIHPAGAAGAVIVEEDANIFFKLPDYLDYLEEGVAEYWDCSS